MDLYEERIEQFADEWNITWETEELIDDDGIDIYFDNNELIINYEDEVSDVELTINNCINGEGYEIIGSCEDKIKNIYYKL